MRKLSFLVFPVIAILYLVSCSKPGAEERQQQPVAIDSLVVTPTVLTEKPDLQQTDSITVLSTTTWTLSIPTTATWITADTLNGSAGIKKVHFKIAANNNIAPRSAVLLLKSGAASVAQVPVTINQDQPRVKITSFTYKAKGGSSMTITGLGFGVIPADNQVKINGVAATVTAVTNNFNNNRTLTVTVPPKVGSGRIIVAVNTKSDTTLGNFIYDWVGVCTEYVGAAAQLLHPAGLDMDASGNLYVADYANYQVKKISASGVVTTLPGYFMVNGTNTGFGLPQDIAVDKQGNVFVAEVNADAISKIATDGTVTMLAGGSSSYYAVDGPAASARFYMPTGIAIDATGNLIIADFKFHRIRKLDMQTNIVSTVAGGYQSYADGTGSAAFFNMPLSVAIDPSGNYIVSDYYNGRIRKVTPAGVVTTLAGSGYGSADGDGINAGIPNPSDIAIDKNGDMFICDGNSNIRWITPAGKVSTITPNISVSLLQGIAVDPNGVLYVSDYYNNRILKVVIQ